jgi:hypothetical protein
VSAEDQTAVPDAPDEPAPQVDAEQEAQSESTSYGDTLLKLAAEDGYPVGELPKAEETTEPDTLEEVPATEPEPEGKPEEEEEKPEEQAKLWPASAKARVAEETARKRRATERAEKAEALAAELQTQLQKVVAIPPTEADPFADIQNPTDLERLERSYEKAIDLADENPDGAIDVLVGKDKDGQEIRRDFTQEELVTMRRKAEKAVRKQIPERRTYLQQRAMADAQAMETYPELKDPKSEFSQQTAYLIYQVLSGRGMKEPDVAIWAARAVRAYRDELKRNGNDPGVKSTEGKRILQAARQQIAPTTTRTRSIPERRGAVNLDKLNKEFEAKGTPEAAEKLLAAMRLGESRGSSKRLESIE